MVCLANRKYFGGKEMKKLFSIFIVVTLIILVQMQALAENVKHSDMNTTPVFLTDENEKKIENYILGQMKKAKIPGLSVIIMEGDNKVYKKCFGYADIKSKTPVTPDTLFELGSNTKAFTGLGILLLKSRGLIDLDDPVDKYLPWFWMEYEGEKVSITIEQVLHQTSGIPFETTGYVPVSDDPVNGIENTVRMLVGRELENYPGEEALYATVNYDILGLIIQKVSGQTYENFMKNDVISQLGLMNTYIAKEDVDMDKMAKGYKIGFNRALEYNPPFYRGNTPAGYMRSNINDMETWLRIQLGMNTVPEVFRKLIEESHIPDRTVNPFISYDNTYGSYAAGWDLIQSGKKGEYFHAGSNPTFSSSISFRPEEKLGVVVLSNLNSLHTMLMAPYIINLLRDKRVPEISDIYKNVDNACFTIIIITGPLSLAVLSLIIYIVAEILKKRRKFSGMNKSKVAGYAISVLFIAVFGYCIYKVPEVLFSEFPWEAVKVWGPISVIIAIITTCSLVVLFYIYYVLTSIYIKTNEKSLFTLGVLSLASGFGNALIIFVINIAINNIILDNNEREFEANLFLYFLVALIIYVFGQKLIRSRLILITNNYVYSKRMELIHKIFNSSYYSMESMEKGKLQAGLNNDPETVSSFANTIITIVTALITLITCFIYLGFINIYGLLVSLCVIVFASGLYFVVGRAANRIWEQTRDIQNIFFKYINDIIYGFKELNLSRRKQNEFSEDMSQSCLQYRDKRVHADMKFANAFILGELLFTIVIGTVTFFFPLLFDGIGSATLRSYVFVFLYMTGPVNAVLNSIPNLIQMNVSYNRLKLLSTELTTMENTEAKTLKALGENNTVNLKLIDVEFEYKNSDSELFKVGPINLEFKSSEITFITGGNGSGKSSLAKLVTGLYKPEEGKILFNGRSIDTENLKQMYSAIFSDFYLFEKLYGIEYEHKNKEIEEHLSLLHISDKVKVDNGVFSSTKLSTGQRKRMALLISYLENKPIILFDEWAADQDPEFRKYFYMTLLPELKQKGKCIIAITHDDSYFHVADKVIKMEMGKIVKQEEKDAVGSSIITA